MGIAGTKQTLSFVIPVYNEEATLGECVAALVPRAADTGMSCEVIIVDDGSTDGTWEVIRKMSVPGAAIRGIRLSRNFGKESAIAAGMEFAAGDAVILMDGDLQHPPDLIPLMVQSWRVQGYDVVEAVKTHRGEETLPSRAGAGLFYWLMGRLTDLDLDNASDFKLLDRKVVAAHNRLPERARFFRGIVSWLGFRKTQLPFAVGPRASGKSKWSFLKLAGLLMQAVTSFSSAPLHVVTALGIVTFCISVVLGIQTLYMKLSGQAVSGFATVILLLLFIGSVLMFSLGVIGIYISRIFEEVKQRPRFVIEKTMRMKDADLPPNAAP